MITSCSIQIDFDQFIEIDFDQSIVYVDDYHEGSLEHSLLIIGLKKLRDLLGLYVYGHGAPDSEELLVSIYGTECEIITSNKLHVA